MAKSQKSRGKGRVVQMLNPENYIKQKARNLQIHECFVNSSWQEDGLANILISRKHTNGNFTVGLYLVDLKCLGVKDTEYYFNISPAEYRSLFENMSDGPNLEQVDYGLVHNIIYSGFEYADDYGFDPYKKFAITRFILEEDTDDIDLIDIKCGGEDGNPLYVQGPYDDDALANKVMAQLEKTAGSGNYNFIKAGDVFDDDYDDELDDFRMDSDYFSDYVALLDREEELEETEIEEMMDLVEVLFDKFSDYSETIDISDEFIEEIDRYEIVKEVPDEILKQTNLPLAQYACFKEDYNEMEGLVRGHENAPKASLKFKKMQGAYPDNELLSVLELLSLQSDESEEYISLLEKKREKYPNSALIVLFSEIASLESVEMSPNMKFDINISNIFDKLFLGRTVLYVAELYYTLFYLLLQGINSLNMVQINAISDLIYDIDLCEDQIEILDTIVVLAKKTMVDVFIEEYIRNK